jgi:hypothetical protein
MMETHCLWRYKNVARWLLHDDIDEYIQPLGGFESTIAALRDLASRHPTAAAFQIPQSFWGHVAADNVPSTSLAIWNMTWRSSGPFRKGREKMIVNTEVRISPALDRGAARMLLTHRASRRASVYHACIIFAFFESRDSCCTRYHLIALP